MFKISFQLLKGFLIVCNIYIFRLDLKFTIFHSKQNYKVFHKFISKVVSQSIARSLLKWNNSSNVPLNLRKGQKHTMWQIDCFAAPQSQDGSSITPHLKRHLLQRPWWVRNLLNVTQSFLCKFTFHLKLILIIKVNNI